MRRIVAPRWWLPKTVAGWPLFLAFFSPVIACAQPPSIEEVRVGFQGHFKVGFWTQVGVRLTAGAERFRGRLAITTVDGDLIKCSFADDRFGQGPPAAAIELRPGETKTFVRYVKFGRKDRPMKVELYPEGSAEKPIAQRTVSRNQNFRGASATSRFVLSIGSSVGIPEGTRGGVYTIAPVVEDFSQLPDQWYGYEGLDMAVITTGKRQVLSSWSAHAPQLQALLQWVRLGGRVLISVGVHGREALGENGPFASLAPGRFVEVRKEQRTGGIEEYAGAKSRLDRAALAAGQEFALPITILGQLRGQIEVYEGRNPRDLPLVIRYSVGMGQVVLATFDLDVVPVADWEGRPRLISRLLKPPSRRGRWSSGSGEVNSAKIGYEDMSGQLRNALERFPGVPVAAFTAVAGLIMAYILLIGPADYFLLRRLDRLRWTWLTFPLAAFGFLGLVVWWAQQGKENQPRMNQVDLVDIDISGSAVRGTSWATFYSPRARAYDFTFRPIAGTAGQAPGGPEGQAAGGPVGQADGVLFSWQGLPGAGLGGMSNLAQPVTFDRSYSISPRAEKSAAALVGLPINVSSTKSIVGRWWSWSAPAYTAKLQRGPNGTLVGEIENPLSVDASDGVLFYGSLAYTLSGGLEAGGRMRIEQLSKPRTLEWMLSRTHVQNTDEVSVPWEVTGVDVDRIMEIMMFYRTAGGKAYTGLHHRFQNYVDWSELLDDSHAVLTFRVEQPATEILHNGQAPPDKTRRWVFYRLKLPVQSPTHFGPRPGTSASG